MKRSQLIQIIKEEIKGYSKYAPGGVTKGGSTDDFRNILTRIAKEPAPYELPDFSGDLEKGRQAASVERGNKILDKADPENVERILRGEKPVYKNESIFSPNYVTNVRPKGSFNDLVNVDVYKGDEGGYDLALSVYTVTGNGMSEVRRLKFADRTIPIDQFTAEHVIDRVGTVYKLSDKNQQELTDFVNTIPSKLT
jgi:hypothetical protein